MNVTPSITSLARSVSRDEQATLYAAAVARGLIPRRDNSPPATPVPPTVLGVPCPVCGDVLWSRNRHDWRECGCGAGFIDGGRD